MADSVETIISRILTRAGLDTSDPEFVTRADVLACVNNMLKDLTENTECFVKLDSTSVVWVAGTRSYTLPTDLYDILHMYDPVNDRPLYGITVEMLDAYSSNWREDSGEVYYFFRGFEGMDKISFYKKPSSSYATYSPQITYRYYPADVTDSSLSYLPSPIRGATPMTIYYGLKELFDVYKGLRDIEAAEKNRKLYERERSRFTSLDRASGRTFVYGSRQGSSSSLGPQWPSNYPR